MTDWTLADLTRLARDHPPARASRATSASVPPAVKRKLAEKREWARVAGICQGCDEELIRTRDGVLRSTLIKMIGGGFSPHCVMGLHVLDPRRTFYAGRRVRLSREDTI